MEILKKYHIAFRPKVKVGKYAIEFDAHTQNSFKNHYLLLQGYIPLHFANWKLADFEEWVRNTICQSE